MPRARACRSPAGCREAGLDQCRLQEALKFAHPRVVVVPTALGLLEWQDLGAVATVAHPEVSRQIERLARRQAAVEQTFLEHAQSQLQIRVRALERRDALAISLVLGGKNFGKALRDSSGR